jgi:hypothetical protein
VSPGPALGASVYTAPSLGAWRLVGREPVGDDFRATDGHSKIRLPSHRHVPQVDLSILNMLVQLAGWKMSSKHGDYPAEISIKPLQR